LKFSIITICHNSGNSVKTAIESVLSQDYPDIEYIIIDGNSTDETVEVVKSYGDKIDTFVSEPDKGIYDALNKGLRHACGEVVGFVHADDLLADETVISELAKVFKQKNADSVYGDLVYVARNNPGRIIRYWQSGAYSPSRLRYGWMPPHPALYVKRHIYENTKLPNGEYFDTSLSIAADYDFMTRILGKFGVSPIYLPKVLVKMRSGGKSNRCIGNILQKSYEDYLIIRRNDVGGIGTLFAKNLCKLPQFFKRQKQMI
jgi:glycosyltransferase involved in cell wall biosynthesis